LEIGGLESVDSAGKSCFAMTGERSVIPPFDPRSSDTDREEIEPLLSSKEDSIGGECVGNESVRDEDTGRLNEILLSRDRRFFVRFVECSMGSRSNNGSTLVLNSNGEISKRRI
jgi:hypothetical protein